MKPLAHVLPPYRRGDDTPVAVDLPAAGAASAMLIDEGALNRYTKILDPLHWRDDDESHPPSEVALKTIAAKVLRAPAKNDMVGPVHAILHVETLPRLRDHVTAAQVLRANLPKSTQVSIGVFPGTYSPADEAWADAEKLVDAVCLFLYPSNVVCRGGLDAWIKMIDDGAAKLRALFPKRKKWVAFLTHGFQVWNAADPANADIVAMNWKPVPVAWWAAANRRLQQRGFTPLWWGPCPPFVLAEAAEHLDVFRRVWGLMLSEPAVVA